MPQGGDGVLAYLDRRIAELEEELRNLRLIGEALSKAPSREVKPGEGDLPTILESVRWRRYPSGNGEWSYGDQVPPELSEMLDAGPATVGEYTYVKKRLSGGEVVIARKRAGAKAPQELSYRGRLLPASS